jgi:hypothetical protein
MNHGEPSELSKHDLVVFGELSNPDPLKRVTLCVNKRSARLLAEFLIKCADEMEENDEWEHTHFLDEVFRWERAGIKFRTECDLIIMTTAILLDPDRNN